MSYRIEWNEDGGKQEKEVASATLADNWVDELNGKGADGIALFRDGTRIEPDELPELTRKEAAGSGDAAES
ncbi:MAG: hypothetical protein INR65_16960 [Gluconacetobacter diazotrophicus]|nr:hypothetical protein [Gluconacetobacter diazotrophicus]